MGYQIIRGPYMLHETVSMLYKYVNKVTFHSILSRQRLIQGTPATKALTRRMDRLQEIMDEVCRNLNPDDPKIRRFFGRVNLEDQEICLMEILLQIFGRPEKPGFLDSVENICRDWAESLQIGIRIQMGVQPSGTNDILSVSTDPTCKTDLFEQIYALDLPSDLRLDLYHSLRDFDQTMSELVQMVLPLSDRLEAMYQNDLWLLEESEDYWRQTFEKMTPNEYLLTHSTDEVVCNARQDSEIAISLMNCNNIFCWLLQEGATQLPNFIYIGCGIMTTSIPRKRDHDLEKVGSILRSIGDKKRLEILRRLSKEKMYLHELAELMEIDPGTMSRILTALHGYGFLRQERVALRNYYQTDRDAVHGFLELMEEIIFN